MTPKQIRFVNEYFIDFNATQAYIRAGYAPATARQSAYKLLRQSHIKEVIEQRLKENQLSVDVIVARLQAMVEGSIPTKVIETPSKLYDKPIVRKEFDTLGALRDLGKVYALFAEKTIVENIGLEIIDGS
jgi:hypothetical protein